jgi:signal transduction histidine kinase
MSNFAKEEAEALRQKNIRMEAEAKAKSEYISILSHELKTPLTAIQGSLGILLSEDLPERPKELLSIAYRNTERLGNIIKAVLDVERFQEGKFKIESKIISVVPLLKEAIATSQFLAQKKNIYIIDEVPLDDVCVFSDYNRLFQVCLNLLSNAIKFSYFEGKVTVSMEVTENRVIVYVKDEGCGVPEYFRSQLFMPFSQASQGDMKAEGVGLGLHISKKIIDLFGGKIGCDSIEGQGAIFYFELPKYSEGVTHDAK